MNTLNVLALIAACAPLVHPTTAQAIIAVESAFNPYAIGVVGGALDRQPRNRLEAVATAKQLQRSGWNFSVGLAQINLIHFERLGLNVESAFDACHNLRAMQTVLGECFRRVAAASASDQSSLRRALSCYYSGDSQTGFRHGYVQRVMNAAVQPLVLPLGRPEANPIPSSHQPMR